MSITAARIWKHKYFGMKIYFLILPELFVGMESTICPLEFVQGNAINKLVEIVSGQNIAQKQIPCGGEFFDRTQRAITPQSDGEVVFNVILAAAAPWYGRIVFKFFAHDRIGNLLTWKGNGFARFVLQRLSAPELKSSGTQSKFADAKKTISEFSAKDEESFCIPKAMPTFETPFWTGIHKTTARGTSNGLSFEINMASLFKSIRFSKSLFWNAQNLKCGLGRYGRSKIGSVISAIGSARIPAIEPMTPNLFHSVNRLNLWKSVIFISQCDCYRTAFFH
jgi:hypothetical protein